MALAAAAVAEAPFAVEDVGRDHGDDAGDDLRRDRLGLQHRQLERVEDRRVDDERRRADDRELDELVMPFGVRPDRAWQPRDRGIGEGHKEGSLRNVRAHCVPRGHRRSTLPVTAMTT